MDSENLDFILILIRRARGQGLIRGKLTQLPEQKRLMLEASPRNGQNTAHTLIFEFAIQTRDICFFPAGFPRNRFFLSMFPNETAWFSEAIQLNTGNSPFVLTDPDKATYK